MAYLAQFPPRFGYFLRPVAYGIQLALLLAAASLAGLRRTRLRTLLICWALVAALFTVAGSRIDMVDKQIFYLVPALALLAGRLLARLWQRGLPARLVVASVYIFTFAAALDLVIEHRLQFWDALIVNAAAEAGCTLLLSEDMQDGFMIRGVTIVNPLADKPHEKLARLLA